MSATTTNPQKPSEMALRLLAVRQQRAQVDPSGPQVDGQVATEAEVLSPGAAGRRRWRWWRWFAGAALLVVLGAASWFWAPASWLAGLPEPAKLGLPRISQMWGLGARLPSGAEVAATIRSREGAETEAELARRAREIARLNAALQQEKMTSRERETDLLAREAAARAAETARTGGADGARLMQIYGTMRPRDMARIFKDLSNEQALWILQRLDTDTAAKVLVALDPDRAAALSIRLLPPG